MGAMVVFLILWSGGLMKLMMMMLTMTPCVVIFLRLGLHTNKLEDEIRLSRSKYHIAPGKELSLKPKAKNNILPIFGYNVGSTN